MLDFPQRIANPCEMTRKAPASLTGPTQEKGRGRKQESLSKSSCRGCLVHNADESRPLFLNRHASPLGIYIVAFLITRLFHRCGDGWVGALQEPSSSRLLHLQSRGQWLACRVQEWEDGSRVPKEVCKERPPVFDPSLVLASLLLCLHARMLPRARREETASFLVNTNRSCRAKRMLYRHATSQQAASMLWTKRDQKKKKRTELHRLGAALRNSAYFSRGIPGERTRLAVTDSRTCRPVAGGVGAKRCPHRGRVNGRGRLRVEWAWMDGDSVPTDGVLAACLDCVRACVRVGGEESQRTFFACVMACVCALQVEKSAARAPPIPVRDGIV